MSSLTTGGTLTPVWIPPLYIIWSSSLLYVYLVQWTGGVTHPYYDTIHYVAMLLLWRLWESSWLQIQRSGFDSRRHQIFWEVVGLEQGPLNLLSAIEELLGGKSSGSSLENREYRRGDPSRWPRGTLCPQKLALTSPTSVGRSDGIVRSRTQAMTF
jgi:hypothetical protein